MRDKTMDRWSSCEPFYVELADKRVADIVITNHAQQRWNGRISNAETDILEICSYMWEQLKKDQIQPYYRNEEDVYLVEEDLVFVAEFPIAEGLSTNAGEIMHRMIVVTFLGKMSETMELRDLKSYYSWLRHSRRMTLIKNSRKRR